MPGNTKKFANSNSVGDWPIPQKDHTAVEVLFPHQTHNWAADKSWGITVGGWGSKNLWKKENGLIIMPNEEKQYSD